MRYVKRLDEMSKEEFQETGGKAANLGELIRGGFNVPGGFCVAGKALDYLMEAGALMPKIREILRSMNFEEYGDIEDKSAEIRGLITGAPIPEDLRREIGEQIGVLRSPEGEDPFVAVRSWGS